MEERQEGLDQMPAAWQQQQQMMRCGVRNVNSLSARSRTRSKGKHSIVDFGREVVRHYHWVVEKVGVWRLATRLGQLVAGCSTGPSMADLETCIVGWKLAQQSVSCWLGR